MLSCTEEGMCVGVRGFMFWQILPPTSLFVWLLEGFGLYIYIQQIIRSCKYIWCLMRNTVLRDTSSIIGPD